MISVQVRAESNNEVKNKTNNEPKATTCIEKLSYEKNQKDLKQNLMSFHRIMLETNTISKKRNPNMLRWKSS